MNHEKHAGKKYLAKNINKEFGEKLTLGQKVADKVASFGGSWPFIILFFLSLIVWMLFQTVIEHNRGFDPFPYILLNLILSCLAAIQAPVIMMSQNRQAQKDRLQADHDYETNLKAEQEIEQIQIALDIIAQKQEALVLRELEEIKAILNRVS